MASFAHFDLTLTGAAQQLSDLLPAGRMPSLRALILQADPANAGPVYLGDASVSSSSYAVRIPIPVAGIPAAPFILGEFESGPMKLQNFWVLGDVDEVLHVSYIAY